MDLLPLPTKHLFSEDVKERVGFIQKLHEQIKGKKEKQNMKYQVQANKHRNLLNFKKGLGMDTSSKGMVSSWKTC